MSKKGKRDKYGSSYDPNSKNYETPPLHVSRDELEHSFGGIKCGHPGCIVCDPYSTRRDSVPSPTERNPRVELVSSLKELEDLMSRGVFGSVFSSVLGSQVDWVSSTAAGTAEKGPPESYRLARQAVVKWIKTAPEQSFEDIVGNEEALALLRDAIEAPVKHRELHDAYGLKMPKGALLSGPPGCGKTMFARAAVSEMRRLYGKSAEFISINGSSIQSKYVGETEKYIIQIFTYAREYKKYHGFPLVVFMDEAEVMLPDRTGRTRWVAPWEESQVATFLAETDGMEESGAFVLLATNRPNAIDQAVLRDGRCDFKITVKRPTKEAVGLILQKNFSSVLLKGDTTVADLVFTALESLTDPHKVITEAHAVRLYLEGEGLKVDTRDRHFLLEHILSGAMAASIPARASRHAFYRDKSTGVVSGVKTEDVVKAVNDLFEENRLLDHAFAFEEFTREFLGELNAADKAKITKLNNKHH